MKIKYIIIIFIMLATMAGCSSKKQAVQEPIKEPVTQEPAKQPFTETPAPEPAVTPAPEPQGSQYTGSKGPVQDVWGWRVQIFASATLENARKVAEEARWKFGNQQIYVSELEPYFKVQVGNNLTRQDAEKLKAKAKALGYKGVFVVEVNLAE
jgi:cell division septation protein DedD